MKDTFGEEWDWQGQSQNEGKEIEALKEQIACLTRQAERFDEVGNFVGWDEAQMGAVRSLKGKLAEMRAEKAPKAPVIKVRAGEARGFLGATVPTLFFSIDGGEEEPFNRMSFKHQSIVENALGMGAIAAQNDWGRAYAACQNAGICWEGEIPEKQEKVEEFDPFNL